MQHSNGHLIKKKKQLFMNLCLIIQTIADFLSSFEVVHYLRPKISEVRTGREILIRRKNKAKTENLEEMG